MNKKYTLEQEKMLQKAVNSLRKDDPVEVYINEYGGISYEQLW